jgi:hypothetical protein
MKRTLFLLAGFALGSILSLGTAQTATPREESKGQLCRRLSYEYYAKASTQEAYASWFPLWQQHFYATAAAYRDIGARLVTEAELSELGEGQL